MRYIQQYFCCFMAINLLVRRTQSSKSNCKINRLKIGIYNLYVMKRWVYDVFWNTGLFNEWVGRCVITLWSLLCFILLIYLASKTVVIIMKLIVIVVIYCLQRYIFQQTGLNIDYMFCKRNGHKIDSSSPKLGI